MSEKSLSEKLLNSRIPFPADDDETAPETAADTETGDQKAHLRDFALRFASIFRGFNNAEIARHLGTTDAVVKNYVDGKRFPNDKLLFSITRATGVNLHWLLTGEGAPRVERIGNELFSENEAAKIQEMANLSRRSFERQVHALTVAAIEFIEKI